MMKRIKLLIAMIVIGLMMTACGASSNANVAQPATATTTIREIQADTPTVVPTDVPVEPFLSAPGVGIVELLTDIQGVGRKPLFQWEAIPAAERYQLMVFDEAADPYWAWEGSKTQIYMGGTDAQPPEDSSGPSIGSGYTWLVVAYGSDGNVLATSEVRAISP
jgi:hypothetical protein